MPNTRPVMGEPAFRIRDSKLWGPVGQAVVMMEAQQQLVGCDISARLADEYLAIGQALKEAGEEFGIINLSLTPESGVYADIRQLSDLSVVMRQSVPGPIRMYPRDMAVIMERLWLLNEKGFLPLERRMGEVRAISSPLGEGGCVLYCPNTAITCEYCWTEERHEAPVPPYAEAIAEAGVNVIMLPNPICGPLSATMRISDTGMNDHIDRVAGLLTAPDGSLHLVVDTGYYSNQDYETLEPPQTIRLVQERCAEFEITVHIPRRVKIPYSMGFYQAGNGKVVLTAGDEYMAELVAGIVGEDNVIPTLIPILAYPVIAKSSIRCLIGELPATLCS